MNGYRTRPNSDDMDATSLMMAAIVMCAVLAVLAGAAIVAIDRSERRR